MSSNIKHGLVINDKGIEKDYSDMSKTQLKEMISILKNVRPDIKIVKCFKYQTSRGSSKSPYVEQWGRKQVVKC